MSGTYSLPRDKLRELLASFEGYDLYAPRRVEGVYQFERASAPGDVALDYSNSAKPPKHIVFPQAEPLMDYTLPGRGFELTDRSMGEFRAIVIGVRSCDARAMLYLDKVMYEGGYVDPYYKRRREGTTLIGLACNKPPYHSCFCTSLGGGPHSKEGLDAHITEMDGSYVVEALTEKGERALESARSLMTPASQAELTEREDLGRGAEQRIARRLDVEGVPERMADIFESDYWIEISMPCIGCGVCTFLCPTCFCFDISDIGNRRRGQRVRVWDSCQFPEYTLHASSHNPRDDKVRRQRQRFYHKYKYSVDNQGMIGCVGCGRCVNQCPARIDIVKVIGGVMEVSR